MARTSNRVNPWILAGTGAVVAGGIILVARKAASAASLPPFVGRDVHLWNTFYKRPRESDFSGEKNTPIHDMQGNVIAMVSHAYAADLCIEGSGELSDGRIVNFADRCSWGFSCAIGGPLCYRVLDRNRYPWGAGVQGRALVPLRSIAADLRYYPAGTQVYIARFDGLYIPRVGELGGFTHDGRFRVDDAGGAISGDHVDIYAGTTQMYQSLERLVPTRTQLAAKVAPPT